MLRNVIKYGGLALVLVGIVIVMSNLFTNDTEWQSDGKNKRVDKNSYYSAKISLLDQETNAFISGASLVVKDENGTVVSGWTTEDGVHLISNLKNGTYTLVQETTSSDYHLNSDVLTFKIKDKDKEVVMYNIKMTEEEKKAQGSSSNESTTSSEVGVENTLSTKNVFSYLFAIICIGLGINFILGKKEFTK